MIQDRPALISLPKIKDVRGNLSFIEGSTHIPFDIQRVYYIYDVPGGESRGEHAHKELAQLVLCLSGGFFMDLDDGLGYQKSFHLTNPAEGLYIPPGFWRKLHTFTSGAVCMVLASHPYDEGDYIRDYDTFLEYKQKGA